MRPFGEAEPKPTKVGGGNTSKTGKKCAGERGNWTLYTPRTPRAKGLIK